MRWQTSARFFRNLAKRDPLGCLLPLSTRELGVREAFYTRLKNLNRRGTGNVMRRPRVSPHRCKLRNVSAKYLAGFVDAEGCLMIAKAKRLDYRRSLYSAKVSIGNTNRMILEDLQRAYGGILANQPARRAGWKDAYQLIWIGRRVERFLSVVGPHLQIKRRHAKVLLQFIGHKKKTRQKRVGRAFAPLPQRVVAYRESLYLQIKKLNAKGPPTGQG